MWWRSWTAPSASSTHTRSSPSSRRRSGARCLRSTRSSPEPSHETGPRLPAWHQNLQAVDSTLLAFVGVSLLLAVTPGPDMAVVTKNALAHGRRGVILTTTGIALALAIWVTATAVGVSEV